jgi:hypothetical protein
MEVGLGWGVCWTPERVIVLSRESVSKGEVYVDVGVVVGDDEGDDDDEEEEDEDGVAGDVSLFELSLFVSVGEGWDDTASDSVPDPVQSIISNLELYLNLNIRNESIPPFFANPTPNPTASPITAATSTPSATHSQNSFFFPIPCCTGGLEYPCPCPYPYPFCAGYPNPGPCWNTASRPGWVRRSGTASLKESPVVVVV